MKKLYKIILTIFIFNSMLIAQSKKESEHLFFWNLQKGERIESVKTADVEYYENGILKRRYQERNIIDLTAYNIATPNGGFRVTGVFKLFVKEKGEEVFNLNEEYKTDFIINTNGRYIVQSQYIMPNQRHIPTFVNEKISKGSGWNSETEQIIIVGSNKRLNLVLSSDYVFADTETDKDNNTNAIIHYHILIDKDLEQAGISKRDSNFPARIYGFNYGTYIWDMKKNIPLAQNERYQILFGFGRELNYSSIEYKMDINSTFKIYGTVSKDEEEEKKESIIKEFENNSGVDVKSVPEGIAIELGEILFDTDSANIKQEAKSTIDNVLDAIKEHYPDREIIVEGHTDNTGDEKYNKALSERRAKAVANFMIPKMEHDKLSYKGYGSTKPVAPNTTIDGKKKNRRVEIIIKLR